METFWQDLRYGLRMLLKNPGYTLLAALTLALGIGVNTAIFSVSDALLLKAVDFPDRDRLVAVTEHRANQFFWGSAAPANFADWREQAHSFASFAQYHFEEVNLTGEGDPELVQGVRVSANLFDLLGVRPAMGRVVLPQEEAEASARVAILSYGFWQQRFAGDPGILSRNIQLNGAAYTIVGVMPKGFEFPRTAQLWMPLSLTPEARKDRARRYLRVVARLSPGVSRSAAQAEMHGIAQRLAESYPETNRGWGALVIPLDQYVAGRLTRQYLLLMLGGVGFVLLIACSNVANLQLARMAGRQRETAVRAALGAGRWRLTRQMLVESVLLALLGVIPGLLLAQLGVDLMLANMSPQVARFIAGWDRIAIDLRALAFTVGAATLAGVVAGIWPALQSSRVDLNEALKESSRLGGGRSPHRLRNALVVSQVTLALVLLAGAGLMVKGFRALLNVNENIRPEELVSFEVSLPEPKYADPVTRAAFYDRAVERLASLPGVDSAAAVTFVPFAGTATRTITVEGQSSDTPGQRSAHAQVISPDYFRTIGISLLDGRGFTHADSRENPRVVIINKRFTEAHFPGQSPLGHKMKVGAADSQEPWMTIVGVAADLRYDPFEKRIEPMFYMPVRQAPRYYSQFALRTRQSAAAMAGAIRASIAAVDPQLPANRIRTVRTVMDEELLGIGYVAWILGVLGGIALALACVGVYSMLAYAVTERHHEIGVRMALGAQTMDVFKLVVKRGLLLTLTGATLGLLASVALARAIASLVFGVEATDPATFSLVTLTLLAVALLACVVPARRATRVDPMVALRYE